MFHYGVYPNLNRARITRKYKHLHLNTQEKRSYFKVAFGGFKAVEKGRFQIMDMETLRGMPIESRYRM
jgi:hypothetical protein